MAEHEPADGIAAGDVLAPSTWPTVSLPSITRVQSSKEAVPFTAQAKRTAFVGAGPTMFR